MSGFYEGQDVSSVPVIKASYRHIIVEEDERVSR